MKMTSIATQTDAELIIHFIGETASSKLKVVIVGMTIMIRAKVYLIAPKPTAIPPKHPIINKIIEISPKRLNSDAFENSEAVFVSMSLNFIVQSCFNFRA